jgi:L(+)-tartrate dehydratase beta subunit
VNISTKSGEKRIIRAPIQDADIADLRIGELVHFSGLLATGRDDVHRKVVHEGADCPFDFRNMAIYHAGPIVRENNGAFELVSIGPTSSIRMEEWAAGFIKKTGLKLMIGKGGMGGKTAAACNEYKAIHCVYPGGCAVLGAGQIESIENVFWRELGMPECLWIMRAGLIGPLIVSIDTGGNNLFAENSSYYASRMDSAMKPVLEYLERNHI